MNRVRHTWVDYARGIAIILVLYRHVFEGIKSAGIDVSEYFELEYANIFFFSFRMPLFFIISGVFVEGSLKKRGLYGLINNKASTILYPYFLWGIIQITLQIILSDYVNSERTYIDYTYLFYLPRRVDQFWYLYALFNVSITYVLIKLFFNLKHLYSLLIGFIFYQLNVLAVQKGIILGFIGDIMHYFIFYVIGVTVGSFLRNIDNRRFFDSWLTFFIILPIFLYSQYYFTSTNLLHKTKYYDFVEYSEPYYFLMISMLGCIFVISVSFLLQKYDKLKWVHRLGKYSLYIYLLHVFVIAFTRILLTRVFGIHYIPVLLLSGVTLGIILPIIIYRIAEKRNLLWLFSLEKKESSSNI